MRCSTWCATSRASTGSCPCSNTSIDESAASATGRRSTPARKRAIRPGSARACLGPRPFAARPTVRPFRGERPLRLASACGMNLPAASVDQPRESFPGDALALDEATRAVDGYDNSRREAMPDAVVVPPAHEQVAALVAACRHHLVPLTARGRGTNTTGATVPLAGGVVASFERMNRIVRIEPGDRLAIVEPGVLNADLQRALAPHGLFWPPDPTSAPYCTVGGNLACNAGGPRAVKYGASRDNVLGLRAVAGNGTSFRG